MFRSLPLAFLVALAGCSAEQTAPARKALDQIANPPGAGVNCVSKRVGEEVRTNCR